MANFLGGAVTMGFLMGAAFFVRFWRRTRERLFVAFAAAFLLFGVNQALAVVSQAPREQSSSIYLLRILGYVLVLIAIIDKNLLARSGRER